MFEIKWIFLRSEPCVAPFSICMDVTFFRISRFLLTDATDRSKISGDQKRFFIALSLYPLSFSRTLPLTNLWSVLLINLWSVLLINLWSVLLINLWSVLSIMLNDCLNGILYNERRKHKGHQNLFLEPL